MALPTIVFAPDVLELLQRTTNEGAPRTHDDAVGGLLIGKRDGDRLLIVGAIEPGPNAHDERMGFALDVDHVNAALSQWFARDPNVDIAGVWHTHPRDLVEPTLDDVAAAYALREDGGQDVVSVIAMAGDTATPVRCFYLEASNTQRVGLTPVPYTVEPIALAPLPAVVPVASVPAMSSDVPAAAVAATPAVPATPRRPSTARIYDSGVAPTSAPTDTTWTTDETDLVLPPAASNAPPLPRPHVLTSVLYGVVALLVVLGLWYLLSGRGGGGANDAVPTSTAANVAGAAETSVLALTATTAPPTVAPTETVAPTDTAAPSPTRAATATIAPTEVTTETALPLDATVEASAEATTAADATAFAYVLQWQPMSAAQRTAFLARARAADCADCYNVDLIPPEPYQELSVEIDGGPAALNTFEVPSLAYVAPRAAPHTLQVFDADGEAVSPPIDVVSAPDRYYILSILAP